MKRPLFSACVALMVLAVPGRAAVGQTTRADTERRLEALKEQLEIDRSRLSQNTEQTQTTLANLESLEREIALREQLRREYRLRLQELSLESDSLRTSMAAMQEEVAQLRRQYRRRAMHGYKYGRLHDLALILSAESINQMLVRIRYLRRFAAQRQEELDRLSAFSEGLAARQEALEASQVRTAQLLQEAEDEEARLSQLRAERQRAIRQLRSQGQALREDIAEREEALEQLEALMRRLAAAERSRRDAGAVDMAAYRALSGSFAQNRGRLPWPAQGAVVEPFGERVNPVYGTTTTNPGILIATNASAEVRAVFEGEVVLVEVMPDYGKLVTIAHGEYKSVYSNFSLLYVAEGDRVEAGQVIGRAGTDAEPRGRGVFFALFQNGQAVDPSPWLSGR